MKDLEPVVGDVMILDVLKAFVVGVAASVPIGPIAILVIQKTLSKGFKPGFITSLGSTVVDTIFAIVAMFALSFVQAFIEGNSIPIFIIGGIIVIILGLSMSLSDPFRKMQKAKDKERALEERCSKKAEVRAQNAVSDESFLPGEENAGRTVGEMEYKCDVSAADFLTACAMGISNPGAIAVMLAMMAFFGIAEDKPTDWSFFPIILSISAGSASYWFGVTYLLDLFRKQVNMKNIILINRIAGVIVMILGLATLAEGIMRIFLK